MFSRDLIQPVQTLCELLDLIQAQPDQDRTAITFYRGAERGASLTYGEYLGHPFVVRLSPGRGSGARRPGGQPDAEPHRGAHHLPRRDEHRRDRGAAQP
jgi:hypothetical protein